MKKLSEIVSYFDNYEKKLNEQLDGGCYSLTDEQQAIVDGVLREYKYAQFSVLNSPSGCGKTVTIRAIEKECEKRNISIAITASTGKAASALKGQTIHSFMSLKMVANEDAETHEDALVLSKDIQVKENVDILIIDEASMIGMSLFNTIRKGGFKYILFVLDSSQLPPVKDKHIEWEKLQCTQYKLTKTLRARDKDMLQLFDDFKKYRDGEMQSLSLDDYVNGRNIISIDYEDMDYIPANSESCSVAYRNKIVEDLVSKITHKNHYMYNLNSGVSVTEIVPKEKGTGSDFINEQVYYNGEDVKIVLLTNETVAIVKNGYAYYNKFKLSLSKNKTGLTVTNTETEQKFYLRIPDDGIVEYTSLACIDDSYFVFLWDKSEDEYNELLEAEFISLKKYLLPNREIKKLLNGKHFDITSIPDEVVKIYHETDSINDFACEYQQSSFFKEKNSAWSRFMNAKAVCSARLTTSRTINKAQGVSIPAVVVTDVSFYGASLSAQYVAVTRCKHALILVKNVPNIVKGEI